MKTTLEIPDSVLRRAKSKAAELGVPLRQFVTEAVEEKLTASSGAAPKRAWMKHVGKLKNLREETKRINKAIEDAFEKNRCRGRLDPVGERRKGVTKPNSKAPAQKAAATRLRGWRDRVGAGSWR